MAYDFMSNSIMLAKRALPIAGSRQEAVPIADKRLFLIWPDPLMSVESVRFLHEKQSWKPSLKVLGTLSA